MSDVCCGLPYSLHDFGRERDGVSLLENLEILVSDHIEQHGEQRLIAGRLMGREPARTDQDVVGVGEIAIVLAVGKE